MSGPDWFEFIRVDPSASLPIVAQLQQQIRWLIASGIANVGDRLPPIRQSAGRLKIHMHTVRAAYHQLEAAGLVSVRPGAGTVILKHRPSQLLEATGTGPSHTIGVVLPKFNPFYEPILQAIEDEARSMGALVFLCRTKDEPHLAEVAMRQLRLKEVDGLIIISSDIRVPRLGQRQADTLPVVHIDEPQASSNVVQFDSHQAAYMATMHLIEHGHQDICLLTAPLDWPQVPPIRAGYQLALEQAGIAYRPDRVIEAESFGMEAGRLAGDRLLRLPDPARAIVTAADTLALGVMQAARAAGLRLPQDLALMGYNNIELGRLVEPGLSTIDVRPYQAGLQAMALLQDFRKRPSQRHQPILIAPRLVLRASCGCEMNWM